MSELLKINVNEHLEKKNGLSYLSWAWAWAQALKIDPEATWEAIEYPQPDGTLAPCMYLGNGSAIVRVRVKIKGISRVCMLPVMDHRNKAIPNPDAFAVNTATMRCLAKAIAMHGLGLYVYAGEDLPESEEEPTPVIAASFRSSATMGAFEELPEGEQQHITELALEIVALVADDQAEEAWRRVESEHLDDSQKTALWSRLDSKTRAAIKRAGQALKVAA
jgi:hypothetical protein